MNERTVLWEQFGYAHKRWSLFFRLLAFHFFLTFSWNYSPKVKISQFFSQATWKKRGGTICLSNYSKRRGTGLDIPLYLDCARFVVRGIAQWTVASGRSLIGGTLKSILVTNRLFLCIYSNLLSKVLWRPKEKRYSRCKEKVDSPFKGTDSCLSKS